MQWLMLLVLAESTFTSYWSAVNARRFRHAMDLVSEEGTQAAKEYLDSTTVRHKIARCARSVAKDYLQDQAEQRGEVWQP